MEKEKIKVTGSISITYSVYCPHCGYYIDDWNDRDWWRDNIYDENEGSDHEVSCPKCNKEFEISHFEL